MKRILTIGLMLASALALTNCTEEIVDPNAQQETASGTETTDQPQTGIPFQVYASLGAETKTEGYIEENTLKLKTKWVTNDQINVFFAEVSEEGTVGTLTDAGLFTIDAENLAAGVFNGFIPRDAIEEDKTYNWYFVYALNASGSVIDLSTTETTINIGSATQTQSEAGNNAHISGINCPMWGCSRNITGSIYPKVQMKHLASLYEITVQNATEDVDDGGKGWGAKAGDIVIYDVGMRVTTKGQWLDDRNNYQMALCGDFTLDITSGGITKTSDNNNYSVKTILSENTYKELTAGDEATFYFVAAPISVQSTATTESGYIHRETGEEISALEYSNLDDDAKNEYKSGTVTTRQDMLDFMINGSARTRAISSAQYVYEDATVYRYTLPVKTMQYPYMSDAFNITSQGTEAVLDEDKDTHLVGNVISTSANGTTKVRVNGQEVDAYVIGSPDGTTGTVTITGFLKDLFGAIPVGFYVSGWNGEYAEMTVNKITAWLPHYVETSNVGNPSIDIDEESIETKTYNTFLGEREVEVYYESTVTTTTAKTANYTLQKRGGLKIFGVEIGNNLGLPNDLLLGFAPSLNSLMPFSRIPAVGYFDKTITDNEIPDVIMMNEVSYGVNSRKSITSSNLNTFISRFGASFDGLKRILSIDQSKIPTDVTINEVETKEQIYDIRDLSITDILTGEFLPQDVEGSVETTREITPNWPPQEGDSLYGENELVQTVTNIFNALKSKSILGYKITDDICTNEYSLIHMLRDIKVSIELGTTEAGPCVVFWGLDAKGPDVIVPAPTTTTTE